MPGKEEERSRAKRGGNEIFPSPRVLSEREPYNGVNARDPDSGRPLGERHERGCGCGAQRRERKKIERAESERSARAGKHRERKRRRPGHPVYEQHRKEGHQSENEHEALHLRPCRRIGKRNDGKSSGYKLIRRKTCLYTP